MQVPLGLAEAFATAMLTARNASVAGAGAANASAVADVFVGGLQDAALACTEEHRPAAAPHTEAYFQCGPMSTSHPMGQTKVAGLKVNACRVSHDMSAPSTSHENKCEVSKERGKSEAAALLL